MESISEYSDFKSCFTKLQPISDSAYDALITQNCNDTPTIQKSPINEFRQNRAVLLTELEKLDTSVEEVLMKKPRCKEEVKKDMKNLDNFSKSLDLQRKRMSELLRLAGTLGVKDVELVEVRAVELDADVLQDRIDNKLAAMQSELNDVLNFELCLNIISDRISECTNTLDKEPNSEDLISIESNILPAICQQLKELELEMKLRKSEYLITDSLQMSSIQLEKINLVKRLENAKAQNKEFLEKQAETIRLRINELKTRQEQCKIREKQCSVRDSNCKKRQQQCYRIEKRLNRTDTQISQIPIFNGTELPTPEKLHNLCDRLTECENQLSDLENKLTNEENDIFKWELALMEKEDKIIVE